MAAVTTALRFRLSRKNPPKLILKDVRFCVHIIRYGI